MQPDRATILVVEDDPATAELVRRSLRRAGFECQLTAGLAQALTLLASQDFAAVLLDYRLPEGPSWPVLQAAQALATRPPVIVMTALGDERVAAEAIQGGASDYRIKSPALYGELPALVERLVVQRKGERAQALLAAIVGSSHDAIIGLTLKGAIVSWNSAATHLFGASLSQVRGRPLADFVESAAWPQLEQALQRGAAGAVERLRLRGCPPGGGGFAMDLGLSPILGENARVTGIAAIARDVTLQEQSLGEIQLRLRQQAAVAELGRLALQSPPEQDLLERGVELARRTFEVGFVKIVEFSAPDQLRASIGFSADDSIYSQARFTLQVGEPVISEDLTQESRFDSTALLQHKIVSGLSVLISGELRPWGVFGVYSQRARHFTVEDIHCLESLAHVLSYALARVRSEQAVRERGQLAAFEAEVFRAMGRLDQLPDLLSACVGPMVTRLGAALAGAWVLQPGTQFLELVAQAGCLPPFDELRRVQLGQFAVGKVAQTGQPHVSNSFGSEPDICAPQRMLEEGIVGFAGYPLTVEGKVVGVLAIYSRSPLSAAEQGAVEAVAAGAAQAIERVRSEVALRQSQAQLLRVIGGSHDGFWDWHLPSGRVIYSARWANMLGFEPDDLAPTLDAWKELQHPEDRARSVQLLDDCFTGRAPHFEVEFRMRTATGAWKWVLSRAKVASWVAPGQPEWMTGTHVDIDERKRTQEELGRSKQRLELMVKLSPLGVLETSPEGKITAWNPAAERILGYTQEQAMGLHWSAFVPEERKQEVLEMQKTSMSGSGGWHEPCVYLTRDGRHVLLERLTIPLVAEDGQLLGITSMCRDVTESRRVQSQLHKLWRALEQSPVSVVITDPEAVIEYVNPRFEEMTGYTSAEAVGKNPRLLKSGVHSQEFYAQLWQTILSGRIWHGELCNRKKNGQLFWERAVIAPVRAPEGQLTNFVAIKEDITQSKAMARQLADSEAQFQTIFENMAEGYMRGQLGGLITLVNPAAVRLLGYSQAAELVGHPAAMLFATEDERAKMRLDALEQGQVVDYQVRIRRRDGALRTFEGNLRLQRTADGQPDYIEVLFRDSTERIEAEQERVARQAAEAANQLKSEFLAHMSHEIRTPLNAIAGMTYLALSSELPPLIRDYLEHIHTAGHSLQRIIDDILDLSKIEAGRLELERVEFDLQTVLDDLLRLLAGSARDKGLGLRLEVGPEVPPRLLGDPTRLGQVLLNLMSNAVKFTTSGHVSLVLSATPAGPERVQLGVRVEDTGIGITPEQVGNLFQAFCQADRSITRNYGGTGLGLAICQRLVKMMGGEVQVQSSPGQGSCFRFSIPMDVGHLACLQDLRALILVECQGSSLASLLTSLSVEVSGPDSPPPEAGYDLIFVDSTDSEQLERLRQEQPRARLVLVADPHRDQAGIGNRVHAVLFHPITRSQLFNTLQGMLGHWHSARPGGMAARPENQHLGGHRVLVVEDNLVNQRIARELLERAGLQVDVACDGQQAVDRLAACGAQCPWALVLMDVQMPVLDGYAATIAIRQDVRYRDLPILAMTAHVLAQERERCQAAGMNDYIAKPIDPEAMFVTLRRWLPVAAVPESIPDFPAIAGLDAPAGLGRVAGNAVLYRQLLLDFAQQHGPVVERLRQALAAADVPTCQGLAHLLKGVSGNLGISAVARHAEELEQLLRDQHLDRVGPCLQELESALTEAVTAILHAFPVTPRAVAAHPLDLPSAQATVARLDALLSNCDGAAVDCLEELILSLGPAFDPGLPRLSQLVHKFEFEAARVELGLLPTRSSQAWLKILGGPNR